MRRLPAVASLLAVGLLLTLNPSIAVAGPAGAADRPAHAGRTAEGPDVDRPTSAQAREALARARELFRTPPAHRRHGHAGLVHGRAATGVLRDLALAVPALRGDDRRSAERILARPTDFLNPDADLFRLPANTSSDCTTSAYFCIHYATSGGHAATPAFAATVARQLDYVHRYFVLRLGYRQPVSDAGSASPSDRGNPNGKFDVFLGNLGAHGVYGYCTLDAGSPAARPTSYCALDNDFREFGGTPLNSLRATAAHEYFHAIQFAYDYTEDAWLMEGSAVWAEERAFDGVNDYLQYIRGDSAITNSVIPVDQDSPLNARVYSSMLFFEHMTQTLGVTRMREAWEAARGTTYSLQALRSVVASRMSWNQFINRFAVWNSRPPGVGYAERNSYPGGKFTVTKRLGLKTTRSMRTSTMRRDHLASGAIRFVPARASTRTQRIRISVNGSAPRHGAVASVQRRWAGGKTDVRNIHLNSAGDAVLTQPFGKGRISSIVITFANANTTMTNCGSAALVTYSCGGRGAYLAPWQISARVVR